MGSCRRAPRCLYWIPASGIALRHITDDDLELYVMDRLTDAAPVAERWLPHEGTGWLGSPGYPSIGATQRAVSPLSSPTICSVVSIALSARLKSSRRNRQIALLAARSGFSISGMVSASSIMSRKLSKTR